ncbi:MAG: chloride channel protein [Deltaproteobacteria bacterium]
MVTDRQDEVLTPLGQSLGESLSVTRHLLLVIAPLGLVVGTAIAAYDWVVNELLWKRFSGLGLPAQLAMPAVGMFLTGLVLHWFRVRSSAMADEVVKAYHDPGSGIPMDTAAAKLVASVATMGFGGSAGMEGASKWLGATLGTLVQGRLNALKTRAFSWDRRTTLLAGGAAGIAAIFRAPLSGAIMGIESPYKHDLALDALAPGLVASATSFWIFSRLRPGSPYFPIRFHYVLSTRDMLVAVPLGISAGLASHLFLGTLRRLRKRFSDMPFPIYVRTGLGGVALVAIAYAAHRAVGSPVTLQAGLPVANRLLNGQFALWACLAIFGLKLLATAVTFGSGGVGGLFVPTATIGAALGACWDAALSPGHPGIYTILGIAGFSAASYNSLLFSAVFVAEATGNVFLVAPALIASTVAFLVSAGVSNSHAQKKKRPDLEDELGAIALERIMTSRIVTTSPDVTLEAFAHSALLGHHFKALPVIDDRGTFKGMVGLAQLRRVPMVEWKRVVVLELLDPHVPTLCPHHSAADAERLLASGSLDYVPIVDPGNYRLVGIVSRSDLYRARGQARAEKAA